MKRFLALVSTLALILGIAASSFAVTNAKAKVPKGKVETLKKELIKKLQKRHRHHWHRKYRKHRHHGVSMVKTKNKMPNRHN